VAESCTGSSSACPADGFQANGTACDDGLFCTVNDACSGSVCNGVARVCNSATICVSGSCNETSDQCVYQANGLCGVSGAVSYYRDATGAGTEPSTKPVPNVGVDSTGDAAADATTGTDGLYALPNLGGNVTVRSLPKFGTPRASDHNDAVTSFDALLIARSAVRLISLTGKQQLAGDVSGNGVVTAYDAGLVSQFAAQVVGHLPVATIKGSDWQFLRCDGYPVCTNPTYTYTPLSGPEIANFYAILFGDVSGNWEKAATLASMAAPSPTTQVEAEFIEKDRVAAAQLAGTNAVRATRAPGPVSFHMELATAPMRGTTQRYVYLSAQNAAGIQGLDMTFHYDPSRLSIVDVQPVDQSSGFSVIWNDTPGSVEIAFYGYAPINAQGARLLRITVQPLRGGVFAAPTLMRAQANEGQIPTRISRTLPVLVPDDRNGESNVIPVGTPGAASGGGQKPATPTAIALPAPAPRPTPTQILQKDRTVVGKPTGATPVQVSRASAASVYVEPETAPVSGTARRIVFVSADNSAGIQRLDLTLAYDSSKLSIVDVQPAEQASGFKSTWKASAGSVRIELTGAAPLTGGGRLVKITVQPSNGDAVVPPKLVKAQADRGANPATIVEFGEGAASRDASGRR
jgi:hypothetical protein